MAEIWDAYDQNFHILKNAALVRGEAVPEGMYHLVCEIIVKHTDGSYLLMQRDPRKHLGGMWELTAGGSALAGETPDACALRELKEETGITGSGLRHLCRIVHDGHRSIYAEYLCITDREKDNILLQEGETVAFRWVSRTELLGMDKAELASSRAIELVMEHNL